MSPVPNESVAVSSVIAAAPYSPSGWKAIDQSGLTGDLAATNLLGSIPAGDYLLVGDLQVTAGAALGAAIVPSLLWTDGAGAHDAPLAAALSVVTAGTAHFERFFRVASGVPQFKALTTGGVLTGLVYSVRGHLIRLA